MRALAITRLVGISFFLCLFFGVLVCPVHSETLIPLTIKKGTSLIKLARVYCHEEKDWQEIARVNKLSPPYLIRSKSTLQIPLSLLNVEKLSARIATVRESVTLMQGDNVLGEARNNDLLHPGQTLLTDAEGYAYLVFPDNKFTRVAPESQITLNYLLRLADGNVKTELLLTKGRIRHLIKKKLKQNETFRTRTPVAVTGVRGTDFRIKVTGDGGNIVETLSGVVRLAAAGDAVSVRKGQGARVAKGKAPVAPRPLPASPDGIQLQTVYKALPVAFTIPAQDNIRSNRVRITLDKDGNQPLYETIVPAGKPVKIDTLPDGHYYCFVTAVDQGDFESLPAGPFPLFLRTVPSAPFFSSPKNHSISWDSQVNVSWLQSDQAAAYQVELAADKDFQHSLVSKQIKDAHFVTDELQPGTYYFRVRAVAEDGFISLHSLPLSWKVMKQGPVDMGVRNSEGKGLTIQWAAANEDSTYDLQIATDNTFKDVVVSRQGLTSPSCTIKEYMDPGSYFLRIRFSQDDGTFSPWTPPQKMVVEAGPVGMEHIALVATFFLLILL